MDGKKNIVNVALIQSYLDARSKAKNAINKMDAAIKEAEDAQDERDAYCHSMIEDEEILEILKTTGIRTLDDSVIYVDEYSNVLVKHHVNIPCLWELKGNE